MADIIELRRVGGTAVVGPSVAQTPGALVALPAVHASLVIWRTAMAFWGTLWLMPLGLTVEVAARQPRQR